MKLLKMWISRQIHCKKEYLTLVFSSQGTKGKMSYWISLHSSVKVAIFPATTFWRQLNLWGQWKPWGRGGDCFSTLWQILKQPWCTVLHIYSEQNKKTTVEDIGKQLKLEKNQKDFSHWKKGNKINPTFIQLTLWEHFPVITEYRS